MASLAGGAPVRSSQGGARRVGKSELGILEADVTAAELVHNALLCTYKVDLPLKLTSIGSTI